MYKESNSNDGMNVELHWAGTKLISIIRKTFQKNGLMFL